MRIDVRSELRMEVSETLVEVVALHLQLAQLVTPPGEEGAVVLGHTEQVRNHRARDIPENGGVKIDRAVRTTGFQRIGQEALREIAQVRDDRDTPVVRHRGVDTTPDDRVLGLRQARQDDFLAIEVRVVAECAAEVLDAFERFARRGAARDDPCSVGPVSDGALRLELANGVAVRWFASWIEGQPGVVRDAEFVRHGGNSCQLDSIICR